MKNILKITLSLIVSLAFCIASVAETKKTKDGYEFYLKATRNGSEYKLGETAEFQLIGKKNGKLLDDIKLVGEITKDSVPINQKFKGVLKNGKFSVKGTLNEAGFLKCKIVVSFPPLKEGEKNRSLDLLAGAGFDVLNIKPSLPAPDDFDEYWAKQKKILASIPMNIKLTKLDSGKDDVEFYDVQADSFNGKLSAYMAFPKNAKAKSLPAIVFAHGAGVRSSSKQVIAWASRGTIALDFNAHGIPNGKSNEYYDALKNGELKGYPTKNCRDRDTIFFRTLYMRLMRAMDVICAQPQWDGKNLAVSGGSQGGGQALVAGGLNPKVTVVASGFPAICDHSGCVIGRTTGWPHFTRLDANGNYDKSVIEASRYIDAVNFASRIKGKVVLMINYADNVCEPTSCYAAYNNIKSEKFLWINEESRHAPAFGTYAKMQNIMIDFMNEDGAKLQKRTDLNRAY